MLLNRRMVDAHPTRDVRRWAGLVCRSEISHDQVEDDTLPRWQRQPRIASSCRRAARFGGCETLKIHSV